jgi:hypothetical protein
MRLLQHTSFCHKMEIVSHPAPPRLENGKLIFSDGRVLDRPLQTLTWNQSLDLLEEEFEQPLPQPQDIDPYMALFEHWFQLIACHVLSYPLPQTITPGLEPSHSINIRNTLMHLSMTIPCEKAHPQDVGSISLDSITIRPTWRGRGISKRLCTLMLREWVLKNELAFYVPHAAETTFHIFSSLMATPEFSQLKCTPTLTDVTAEKMGLFIAGGDARFWHLRIVTDKKHKWKDEPSVHDFLNQQLYPIAKSELNLFYHSPPSIAPQNYDLLAFNLDSTTVVFQSETLRNALLPLPGFETLLTSFPMLFTTVYLPVPKLKTIASLLLSPTHRPTITMQLARYFRNTRTLEPPIPQRPLCLLLLLTRLAGFETSDVQLIHAALANLGCKRVTRYLCDYFETRPDHDNYSEQVAFAREQFDIEAP